MDIVKRPLLSVLGDCFPYGLPRYPCPLRVNLSFLFSDRPAHHVPLLPCLYMRVRFSPLDRVSLTVTRCRSPLSFLCPDCLPLSPPPFFLFLVVDTLHFSEPVIQDYSSRPEARHDLFGLVTTSDLEIFPFFPLSPPARALHNRGLFFFAHALAPPFPLFLYFARSEAPASNYIANKRGAWWLVQRMLVFPCLAE